VVSLCLSSKRTSCSSFRTVSFLLLSSQSQHHLATCVNKASAMRLINAFIMWDPRRLLADPRLTAHGFFLSPSQFLHCSAVFRVLGLCPPRTLRRRRNIIECVSCVHITREGPVQRCAAVAASGMRRPAAGWLAVVCSFMLSLAQQQCSSSPQCRSDE
jgi:hypothetical protein